MLGYLGADVAEAAVVRIPVPHQAVDAHGTVADQELRQWVAQTLAALADHVRSCRSDPDWVGAL